MQQSSRREKSLSLLCQKFLSCYPASVNSDDRIIICLDYMAQYLEVERRRIYDIVNVLESVEILSRYCKNKYIWHGFSHMPHTLSKLKTLSVKSNFLDYTKSLMASQLENSIDLYQDTKQALNVCYESSYCAGSNNGAEMKDACTQTISISREEKSLGIMSQKFLMLFLTSQDGLVSINFAARVLLGDTKNDTTELGRFKTKIRRLYDIANVLTSIGLIKKYHYSDVNISKPAYKYIGPDVDVIRDAECNPLSNSKHSLFDHFKRNLDLECNIPKFDINTGILTTKGIAYNFAHFEDKRTKTKQATERSVSTTITAPIQPKQADEAYVSTAYDYDSFVKCPHNEEDQLSAINSYGYVEPHLTCQHQQQPEYPPHELALSQITTFCCGQSEFVLPQQQPCPCCASHAYNHQPDYHHHQPPKVSISSNIGLLTTTSSTSYYYADTISTGLPSFNTFFN